MQVKRVSCETKYRVLLLEDDEVDARVVSRMLASEADITTCGTAQSGREYLKAEDFDCLLIDLGLPDADGLDFIREQKDGATPMIILSGHSDIDRAVTGIKAGAYDYLVKDKLEKQPLLTAIRNAIEKRSLQKQLLLKQEELNAANEVLIEREKQLSLIVENIHEVFWIASSDRDRFLYLSPQAKNVWGIDQKQLSIGADQVRGLLQEDDHEILRKHWKDSDAYELEYKYEYKEKQSEDSSDKKWLREKAVRKIQNGTELWVGTTEDITERKQLEARFQNAQRLEELGRLSAGLSHDFNNLLTAILGYSQTALEILTPENPAYQDLQQVEEAGRQAQRLVKQLLGFCKGIKESPGGYCNLSEVTKSTSNLLARTLGEQIQINVSCDESEIYVPASRSEIEQVILNLAVNAADAMSGHGKISIDIEKAEDSAVMSVSDSGQGMSEETQKKLFDAFYTTKGESGTGLGLFTVSEIVSRLGGDVTVTSELGIGTCFHLILPTCDSGKAIENEISKKISEKKGLARQSLLLVENRAELRNLFCRVLKGAGYKVTSAEDGLEAVMHLTRGTRFDLVVTDIQMPGAGGEEVGKCVASCGYSVPILYMTGEPGTKFEPGCIRRTDHFLEKPFSCSELIENVERVLLKNEVLESV